MRTPMLKKTKGSLSLNHTAIDGIRCKGHLLGVTRSPAGLENTQRKSRLQTLNSLESKSTTAWNCPGDTFGQSFELDQVPDEDGLFTQTKTVKANSRRESRLAFLESRILRKQRQVAPDLAPRFENKRVDYAYLTQLRETERYKFLYGSTKHHYGVVEHILDTVAGVSQETETPSTANAYTIDFAHEAQKQMLWMPRSRAKLAWNWFMAIFILISGLAESASVVFRHVGEGTNLIWLLVLTHLALLVDIIISMKTCIEERGIVITNKDIIRSRYYHHYLLIDLFSSFPFAFIFPIKHETIIVRLLQIAILRGSRLFRRGTTFEQFPIVQVTLFLFWVTHFIACTYWMTCIMEGFIHERTHAGSGRGNSFQISSNGTYLLMNPEWSQIGVFSQYNRNWWVPPTELSNSTQHISYLYSLYWATTIISGQSRDTRPFFFVEYLVSIFVAILGIVIFTSIIAGAVWHDDPGRSTEAEEELQHALLLNYLSERVPQEMKDQIVGWYEYKAANPPLLSMDDSLMPEIHQGLAVELDVVSKYNLIKDLPVFQGIQNSICLISVIQALEPRYFVPGEILFQQGEVSNGMYVIHDGSLHVCAVNLNNTAKKLAQLGPGHIFGEASLLTGRRRNATVTSSTYTQVLFLPKQAFRKLAGEFPEFFQLVQQVAVGRLHFGWGKLRGTVRIARYASAFTKYTGLRFMCKDKEFRDLNAFEIVPPENSIMSATAVTDSTKFQMDDAKANVFDYYCYKRNRNAKQAQEKEQNSSDLHGLSPSTSPRNEDRSPQSKSFVSVYNDLLKKKKNALQDSSCAFAFGD